MLKDINLSVEVHCNRPQWAIVNPNSKYNDVKYRLYVSDDLITERNWVWDNNIFLNEIIWITTNTTINTVTIEPILYKQEQATFYLKNLKINNYSYNIESDEGNRIRFVINT
jgi:hypothetical protein